MNMDFELGEWRHTLTGLQYPEVSGPEGWTMWWVEGEGAPAMEVKPAHLEAAKYKARGLNYFSSLISRYNNSTRKFYRPEMKLITKVPPFLDPPRINTGNKAAMFFGFYKRVHAGYLQQFVAAPGTKVRFGVYGMAWYSMKDDPHKSEWVDENGVWHEIHDGYPGFSLSVGIDPCGGVDPQSEDIVWSTGTYYSGFGPIEVEAISRYPNVTLYIRGVADNPFKHCDAYFDTCSIKASVASSCVCPHVDYEKTFHLLPYSASLEQAKRVTSTAFPVKGTMGFCKEDAGSGPNRRNVVSYWFSDNSWNPGELEDFFSTKYPGVNLSRVNLYSPEPEPDPGDPPVEILHPSNNFIGLHMGDPWQDWDKYCSETKPSVAKCFSLGFALQAKEKCPPGSLIVWRKHADHIPCDPANVGQLVAYYDAEITTAAANMGLTKEALIDRMDGMVIESLNEKIGTFTTEATLRAVEFDRQFCHAVRNMYGGRLHAGILTAPIGNPHETEVPLLLPAVEAAIQYDAYVAPHSYWTSNENDDGEFIAEHWPYHAGRWMEWDAVFSAHGLFPRYYLGEGGVVHSVSGTDFSDGLGWRACGDINKYLRQIGYFNQRVVNWNLGHDGRCFGLTLFHYGNWGWDNFALGHGDMLLLKAQQGAL